MKINFSEKDSLYKIFNTIEKIPSNKKQVKINIHHENPFFENIWWGKQLKDTLETKKLDYEFLSSDLKTGKYFQELGVKYINEKGPIIIRTLNYLYQFFFKAKNAHVTMLREKNYFAYLIIFIEIIAVSYIFYLFYALISPSAKIYIKPTYSMEQIVYNFRFYPHSTGGNYDSKYISIPYHSGSIEISNTLSFNVANIKYLQNPATGKVKITNTAGKGYSLKANTKFVTDDGLIFRAKSWINIDAGTPEAPAYTYVDLEAMDIDGKGQIIGDRGNIKKGTTLYAKNLHDSFYMKKLFATTENDFIGGKTLSDGVVDQKDIDAMNQKLTEYIENNKKQLVMKNINDKNKILLSFNDIISPQIIEIKMNGNIGDKLSKLEGTINAKIYYKYVLREEFKQGVKNYIKERDSKIMKLSEIDQHSVLFFEKYNLSKVFVIPTRVDIIWGYDFHKDANGIKEEIKSKIIGKDIAEAKKIILDYPQIDVAIVKVAPAWYENIPTLKSRIKIDIGE